MSAQEESLLRQFQECLKSITTLEALDELRVSYMGKNGIVTQQLKGLKDISPDQRTAVGQSLNQLRQRIEESLKHTKAQFEQQILDKRLRTESLDMTLPPDLPVQGSIHPLTRVMQEVRDICHHLGLNHDCGPDIEDEAINFTALNMPPHHPARSMHDTFYVAQGLKVLRTHTSSVQVRALKKGKLPLRIFSVGRTYRADWDATHTPMFHQVDGVWVDREVHMGHLKGFLSAFLKIFFERDNLPIRFRPSFFPFTEPSAEVDIGYGIDPQSGQRIVGSGDQWMEILGCGMIHPNVLSGLGIDPSAYQGFAFGMGIERLAMLKYGIPDMRKCYDGDIPWLRHFSLQPAAGEA